MRAVHPIDRGIARVGLQAARRAHRGDCNLAGVLHEDCYAGLVAGGCNKAAFQRKRADARQDIAAILGVGDHGLVDEHLQEQVIDVDAIAHGFAHDRDFAGQRIGRAHHGEEELVTVGRVGRQVGFEEVAALRGTAAHPHAGRGSHWPPSRMREGLGVGGVVEQR